MRETDLRRNYDKKKIKVLFPCSRTSRCITRCTRSGHGARCVSRRVWPFGVLKRVCVFHCLHSLKTKSQIVFRQKASRPSTALASAASSRFLPLATTRRLSPKWNASVANQAFIRHFVPSMPAPVASGWSGRRVGLAPTGKRRFFTAQPRIRHAHLLFCHKHLKSEFGEIRRDVFHDVAEPDAAIDEWIAPFTWTAKAKPILASRCRAKKAPAIVKAGRK
jgi:hypothetical protein